MLHRKNHKSGKPSEQEALEKRVDAMLDPQRPDSVPADEGDKPSKPPPLDIFEGTGKAAPEAAKTAPKLPDKLAQETGAQAAEVSKNASLKAAPKGPKAVATDEAAPPAEPAEASQPKPVSVGDRTADVDDQATDQAVDDIAAHEADTMLAVQDALGRKHSQPGEPPSWKTKLKKILKSKRTWAVITLLLIIFFALPATRYTLIGLVVKKPINVTILDSKTMTPVSNALVSAHGVSAKTDANGRVSFKAAPGATKLTVSKRYYKTASDPLFIGLKSGARSQVRLVATGRQVPITVLNKLTGQPLANAVVSALKTSVKTDARGKAVIVLPATVATDKGTVKLKGYNTAQVTLQVTNNVVSANTFNLVLAGHIYFLSNLSGTIDLVKTNLDGSNRQTVLAGTGKEDPTTMSLLASRDWRYLVLKSQRDTAQPVLYLIDTSNDKVTPFDSNNGSFNLIGWYGHDFMYDFVSNTTPQSQSGHEVIKGYDADHLQLNQLDQSQAEGSADSYAYQDFFNFYVLNNQLVYNTQWYSGGADIGSKNATIRAVQPNGQNKKDYQTFPAAGLTYVLAAPYQPQAIYYDVYNGGNNSTTYYNFANQTVNSVSLDPSYFKRSYPTYLISPSGDQTFWQDQQNGQNTLFVGDSAGQHPKTLAGLSDYQPYGWFSDNYLLLSKNSGELYIMPAAGLKAGQQPSKVSYYYKPVPTYHNEGYSYGGL